jgi:hypothetical protein
MAKRESLVNREWEGYGERYTNTIASSGLWTIVWQHYWGDFGALDPFPHEEQRIKMVTLGGFRNFEVRPELSGKTKSSQCRRVSPRFLDTSTNEVG